MAQQKTEKRADLDPNRILVGEGGLITGLTWGNPREGTEKEKRENGKTFERLSWVGQRGDKQKHPKVDSLAGF